MIRKFLLGIQLSFHPLGVTCLMVKICMRTFFLLILLAAIVVPATTETAAGNGADQNILTYTVSDQGITVISAVTPYDSEPAVRNRFLQWFKRGFDTVLSGSSPLMIEWNTTAEARAGRHGYDFGMEEAERFLREKASGQAPRIIPIPPVLTRY
jgi:hypothetical protein